MGRTVLRSGIRTSTLLLAESKWQKLIAQSVSCSVLFVLLWNRICFYYKGMGYISAEESNGIGFMAEEHFMGRFEWRQHRFGSQDGCSCSKLKRKGSINESPWRKARREESDQRKAGLDQNAWEQWHKSWINAAAEQWWALKMKLETKGMNNPRRTKKGHSSAKMLLLDEEEGGGG